MNHTVTIEEICALTGKNTFALIDCEFACMLQRIGRIPASETAVFLAAAGVSSVIRQGHSCFPLEKFAGTRYPVRSPEDPENLKQITFPELDNWLDQLKKYPSLLTVVKTHDPGEVLPKTPLILDEKKRLYLQRYYFYEQQIIREIMTRCQKAPEIPHLEINELKNLHVYFKQYHDAEPDWQQISLFMAASQNFTIITGGPGTGKTTVIAAFLAFELKRNPALQVALAAPTGKAAMRLKEAIEQETGNLSETVSAKTRQQLLELSAGTIHRLLGYRFGDVKFEHSGENPLNCDILVLDECSMIPLSLMSKLFSAVKKDCKLLLLGDKNQLPSIEAGTVLADICQCGDLNRCLPEQQAELARLYPAWQIPLKKKSGSLLSGHVMELQKTYRFNEEIRQIALLIGENGYPASLRSQKIFQTSGVSFAARSVPAKRLTGELQKMIAGLQVKINSPAGTEEILRFGDLKKLAQKGGRENLQKAFELIQSFKVLCAVRQGTYGVENVNQIIRDILDMKKDRMPGIPVMITRNDPETKLINGEIGLIWKKHDSMDPQDLCVYFQEYPDREFSWSELPSCETVFAMTVHKSQGSGFHNVLLILPEHDSPVLTTELLYTAVTRAKKRVELWGDPRILEQALERQTQRYSGLADALKNPDSLD